VDNGAIVFASGFAIFASTVDEELRKMIIDDA
jgi:hypothetical protein